MHSRYSTWCGADLHRRPGEGNVEMFNGGVRARWSIDSAALVLSVTSAWQRLVRVSHGRLAVSDARAAVNADFLQQLQTPCTSSASGAVATSHGRRADTMAHNDRRQRHAKST